MDCPCHIIHNCAKKASAAYTSLTGFDVEDACINLYYHFAKGTKRKGRLLDSIKFCDKDYKGLLKHLDVRWLSLETAL